MTGFVLEHQEYSEACRHWLPHGLGGHKRLAAPALLTALAAFAALDATTVGLLPTTAQSSRRGIAADDSKT